VPRAVGVRDERERRPGDELRDEHLHGPRHERERDQRGPLRPLRADREDPDDRQQHGRRLYGEVRPEDDARGGDGEDRGEAARERLAGLSAREHEVALAVGWGRSNAEIAAELHMSVATVKAHVSRLLAKLALDSRVQIALLVQDARTGRGRPG
jgi:DNA-binding CsgD family transcriptional regulator